MCVCVCVCMCVCLRKDSGDSNSTVLGNSEFLAYVLMWRLLSNSS